MGFFSDVFDVLVAPLQAAYDITMLPVNIVADIVSGKNVAGSALDEVKKSVGAGAILVAGPQGDFFGTDKGQDILKSDLLDKVSLGYSSDYAGALKAAHSLNDSGEISTSDFQSTTKFFAKSGAAALGYGAAAGGLSVAGHTVTLTEGLSAVGVGTALARGDVSGALGGIGVPSGVTDGFGAVNNFFAPAAGAVAAGASASKSGTPAPQASEQATTGGKAVKASMGALLIPIGIVGAVYLFSKAKK